MNYGDIYLRLMLSALIPVAVAALFYLLEKRSSFAKLPYIAKQIIIGIAFGIVAVFGTENGVDVGGAVANARDAAPLCAGLFFGGPAGIIAGLIGGVERWFAVAWGAGAYSRVACSVSTVLAGLYAAFLRSYLFDNKRPTWGMGLITGAVMEVVHLTILFLTHLGDAQKAYEIVKICTIPMIAANAVSVMLCALTLGYLSRSLKNFWGRRKKKLSQKVQSWLLLTVVVSYLATTVFVFTLQTGTSLYDATNLMKLYISDVKADISQTSDSNLLRISREVADDLNNDPTVSPEALAKQYNVSEINIVNAHGIITDSTNKDYIGFDFRTGKQSGEFMVIIEDKASEYVQSYQPISFDPDSSELARKYAGVALERGGFVQVGYDAKRFQADMAESVKNLTRNRHIGSSGFMLIADNSFDLVSSRSYNDGKNLETAGIWIGENSEAETAYTSSIYGEDCYWMYGQTEGYYIIAVMPETEVYATRDMETYVNSYMEVLVFALLFLLIYLLIKRLVVDNIRSVNDSLSKIIGGNLDVTVDVRSSYEFSSLSDDINSTVTTLKHYIDAAAARIDEELEFAKKIQLSTLPSTFPTYPNVKEFDIHAAMWTAKEVGGDFYDFYMLGDSKLAFLIADVSGKGIPAAMFMMTAKTIIKGLAESGLPVNEVLTQANEKLCEENDTGMFVTVWMGILDIRTGKVSFACAGHNPPLIYRKDKGFEYLRLRPGFVLAGMEGVRYKAQELCLEPGDRIYLYTDGVTEATDAEKCLYGEERLKQFLDTHNELSAKDTLYTVKDSIDEFVGDAEQFDDITMLMVDYVGRECELIAEKLFPASDEALADATAFVEETLDTVGCGMKASMQISVALEEIFVNIAHYAYPNGSGSVKLSLFDDEGSVKLRFTDTGIPFDPLAKADPDVTLSAEERSIGGLGIYMVKKTMDDVFYEYKDGQNIFTMTKKMN